MAGEVDEYSLDYFRVELRRPVRRLCGADYEHGPTYVTPRSGSFVAGTSNRYGLGYLMAWARNEASEQGFDFYQGFRCARAP